MIKFRFHPIQCYIPLLKKDRADIQMAVDNELESSDYYCLARYYIEQTQDVSKGIDYLNKAIQQEPRKADYSFYIGCFYLFRKNVSESKKYFIQSSFLKHGLSYWFSPSGMYNPENGYQQYVENVSVQKRALNYSQMLYVSISKPTKKSLRGLMDGYFKLMSGSIELSSEVASKIQCLYLQCMYVKPLKLKWTSQDPMDWLDLNWLECREDEDPCSRAILMIRTYILREKKLNLEELKELLVSLEGYQYREDAYIMYHAISLYFHCFNQYDGSFKALYMSIKDYFDIFSDKDYVLKSIDILLTAVILVNISREKHKKEVVSILHNVCISICKLAWQKGHKKVKMYLKPLILFCTKCSHCRTLAQLDLLKIYARGSFGYNVRPEKAKKLAEIMLRNSDLEDDNRKKVVQLVQDLSCDHGLTSKEHDCVWIEADVSEDSLVVRINLPS